MSPNIEMISLKTQVSVNSASPPPSASDASDEECSQERCSADELSDAEFSDGDFSDSDDSSEEEADGSDEDTDSESMAPAPQLEGPDAHSFLTIWAYGSIRSQEVLWHRGVSIAVEAVLDKQADVAAVPVPAGEVDDSEADSSDEAIA